MLMELSQVGSGATTKAPADKKTIVLDPNDQNVRWRAAFGRRETMRWSELVRKGNLSCRRNATLTPAGDLELQRDPIDNYSLMIR